MSDLFPVIQQNLTVLAPAAQKVLPVPIANWHRLQERIKETKDPSARLEACAWAALGAALSFLAVAITLPFSVEWSKTAGNVEHINWWPVVTEGVAIFLTLLFLGVGILALYWSGLKRKLQAKMGEWLVEDMRDFEGRHPLSQG